MCPVKKPSEQKPGSPPRLREHEGFASESPLIVASLSCTTTFPAALTVIQPATLSAVPENTLTACVPVGMLEPRKKQWTAPARPVALTFGEAGTSVMVTPP